MKKYLKKNKSDILLFFLGGAGYNLIEILWRGRTHWSMFFLGGVCFCMVGKNAEKKDDPFIKKCVVSALEITGAEFICGIIVNEIFKMNVWDYSVLPLNIRGQICALYSFFWLLLSAPAIPAYTKAKKILESAF
ncbi:MAG: hypothetical protein ACI4QV_06620 [Acutalibacteraceae bacterium]